jgi:hypothetical protein
MASAIKSLMAVLREKVLPRQESSHSSCSGARRSGIGWANGIGGAKCLTSVADPSTVSRSNQRTPMETTRQHEELLEMLERIADALESISSKQGLISNSLLQLSDIHGSNTPGPYL